MAYTQPPLSAAKQAKILKLHGQGVTRNEIGRQVRCSTSTVSRIVHQAGGSFDGSATKVATEARKAQARARRAQTSLRFLDEANLLLDALHQPHMAFAFGGKDNVYNEHPMSEPPTIDKVKLLAGASTAILRHMDVERFDADQGATDAKAMLILLGEAVGVKQVET
ncbi:MAG TPA: helix-turn-helix domain-containing protein [Acidimicrobiia bacterium]